jgi:hypothetical protein
VSVLPSRRHDGVVAVRRVINDHIAELAAGREDRAGELLDFMCECGDLRCVTFVELTLAEYEAMEPGSVLAHALRNEM